jgi:hypothetical protein
VRNRGGVLDGAHFDSDACQRADGRFTAAARSGDKYIHGPHADVLGFAAGGQGRLLGGEGLCGTTEAERPALTSRSRCFVARTSHSVERRLQKTTPTGTLRFSRFLNDFFLPPEAFEAALVAFGAFAGALAISC